MKTKNCFSIALIVIIVGSCLLLMIGAGSAYLISRTIKENRRLATPPAIFVHTPQEGYIEANRKILIDVTSAGIAPIKQLGMWVDGELVETRTPDPELREKAFNFHVYSFATFAEGLHTLYWQAVDANGLIGQSQPIAVMAVPAQSSAEGQKAPEAEAPQPIAIEMKFTTSSVQAPFSLDISGELLPSYAMTIPQTTNQKNKLHYVINLLSYSTKGGLPKQSPADGTPQPGDQFEPKPPGFEDLQPNAAGLTPIPKAPAGVEMLKATEIPAIDVGMLISAVISNMPKAPSGLQVGFEDCLVRMIWNDNAVDETYFQIWMQRLGGPAQLIKVLNGSPFSGPVWYEFSAPPFGIYSVWVEAVNGLGSQPSEIRGLAVNDANCPQDALAGMLEIEALDMSVNLSFKEVYCYVSLDGFPYQRVPAGDEYIQVLGLWGQIKEKWSGDKHILLPIPADEEVAIQGKCLGRGSNDPIEMGSFQASIPKAQWDGRRLEVRGDSNFTIGYRIRYFGPVEAQGTLHMVDSGIPQPTGLRIEVQTSNDPYENSKLARIPTLYWTWQGDATKLRGFNILLDGKQFKTAFMNDTFEPLLLPTSCSGEYNFQVEANYGYVQSIPSQALHYVQPPCPVMVEIQFKSVYAMATDDDGNVYGPCDTLEIYGYIAAAGTISKNSDTGLGTFRDFTCNTIYSFKELGFSEDTFRLPLDGMSPQFEYMVQFFEDDGGWSDIDSWGRVQVTKDLSPMSLNDWLSYNQDEHHYPPDPDYTARFVKIIVHLRGFKYTD